jgi:hypothetical protein
MRLKVCLLILSFIIFMFLVTACNMFDKVEKEFLFDEEKGNSLNPETTASDKIDSGIDISKYTNDTSADDPAGINTEVLCVEEQYDKTIYYTITYTEFIRGEEADKFLFKESWSHTEYTKEQLDKEGKEKAVIKFKIALIKELDSNEDKKDINSFNFKIYHPNQEKYKNFYTPSADETFVNEVDEELSNTNNTFEVLRIFRVNKNEDFLIEYNTPFSEKGLWFIIKCK